MCINDLKQHILNEIIDNHGLFMTGTEIYLSGLFHQIQTYEFDIFIPTEVSRQSRID